MCSLLNRIREICWPHVFKLVSETDNKKWRDLSPHRINLKTKYKFGVVVKTSVSVLVCK